MLNPKKAREYIPSTAEELGMDPDFVEAVVDFYWKEIRKALSDLKAPQVFVANLGTFRVKHWKLDRNRDDYKGYIAKMDPAKMTFQKHQIKADLESRIAQIEKMMEMVKADLQRKQQIKQERNAKKTPQQPGEDLEK